MNTVSGYFGDWTRWLNKSGGESSETDLLSHNHQQHLIHHHHHEVPYFSNAALLLNAGGAAIYSSQISGGSGGGGWALYEKLIRLQAAKLANIIICDGAISFDHSLWGRKAFPTTTTTLLAYFGTKKFALLLEGKLVAYCWFQRKGSDMLTMPFYIIILSIHHKAWAIVLTAGHA